MQNRKRPYNIINTLGEISTQQIENIESASYCRIFNAKFCICYMIPMRIAEYNISICCRFSVQNYLT